MKKGLFRFFSPKKEKPVKPYGVLRLSFLAEKRSKNHAVSLQMAKPRKEALKVSDAKEIKRNLQVVIQPQDIEMKFYCPIRNAKIYCHSVLVDKLGDLTKFIILSIYKGRSIEEICSLTQMGNITVKEELDYLKRGGLINDDSQTLTALGEQYGVLLEKFSILSEGIDVAFNVFADRFETIEEDLYVNNPNHNYILEGHFIPALARNDNYANSLEIARKQIKSETPFCWEIIRSLYATVKIEGTVSKYMPVYVRDFARGYRVECNPCVKIFIPFDVITYKPRYKWLDEYREALPHISYKEGNNENHLSDKAKALIIAAKEEEDTEASTVVINTISGQLTSLKDDLRDVPDNPSAYAIETKPVQLKLDKEVCNEIYLHETKRNRLYQVQYFPYSRMER